jgi:hypothetical protein
MKSSFRVSRANRPSPATMSQQEAARSVLPKNRGRASLAPVGNRGAPQHEAEVMRALTLALPVSLLLWVPFIAGAVYLL